MRLAANYDTISLPLPAGLRLRRAADLRSVDSGVAVSAVPVIGPRHRVRFGAVASGRWVAHSLPAVPREVANDPAGWPASGIPFGFAIDDPSGRLLPLRFTAPLPKRGELEWTGWSGWSAAKRARARPILPPDAGSATLPDYMALFPGPGWQSEASLADVRAQLAIRETGGALRNAGWAIATIALGTKTIGVGVADGEGRLVIAFPYPAMPAQTPQEASQGRKRVAWEVRVRVYCRELAASLAPGEVPPLEDILAQFDHLPIKAMATIVGPQSELPDQTLVLGETLVLRTALGGGKLSSSLFLKSP